MRSYRPPQRLNQAETAQARLTELHLPPSAEATTVVPDSRLLHIPELGTAEDSLRGH
jgi:hypothetical protein